MFAEIAKNRSMKVASWFTKINKIGNMQFLATREMSSTPKPQNLIDAQTHDFSKIKYDAIIVGGGHNGLV